MRAFALQSRPSRCVWAYATLCRPFERTVAYAAWSVTNRLPPPHALTSIGSRRQRDRAIEPPSLEPMEILRASVAVHWMEDDAPRRQGYTMLSSLKKTACCSIVWKYCRFTRLGISLSGFRKSGMIPPIKQALNCMPFLALLCNIFSKAALKVV